MAGDQNVRRTRINEFIRITPIRVIGPDNEQVGVIETAEAQRLAREHGLDLVEISPDVRPPVCKIMDYGRYKYELSKKEHKNRQSSKQQELKEIRLGRSIKIDPHDVQIRVEQARRFLMAGHKVQITQRFRGREAQHKHLGMRRLDGICEDLADISKLEVPARWVGRQASIVLAPDRAKIDHLKATQPEAIAAAEAAVEQEEAAERAADTGSEEEMVAPSGKKKKDFFDDFDPNQI